VKKTAHHLLSDFGVSGFTGSCCFWLSFDGVGEGPVDFDPKGFRMIRPLPPKNGSLVLTLVTFIARSF